MQAQPALEKVSIQYPEIGICGLSCRLCPSYHACGPSRCAGCKSADRIAVGCPFITCALKKRQIEFCWECDESDTCQRWGNHRKASRKHDSFVCYQKLEENIAFMQRGGVGVFEREQKTREKWLIEVLNGYNDGRSKTYYSIAATVMEIEELRTALLQAGSNSAGFGRKEKSKQLHLLLDNIAEKRHYSLRLRK